MFGTLAEVLEPYSPTKLADELTKRGVVVGRGAIHRWKNGGRPDVAVLPALAEVLRVDLADLTKVVARMVA